MTSWSRLVQRRPMLQLMVGLAVLLAGGMAATRLPLAARPTVEWPRLTVVAQWPGASPEVIEMYVTSPLEAALSSVRGVRHVASTSGDEVAFLEVTLAPRADLLLTRLQLMERLDLVARALPTGVSRPTLLSAMPVTGQDESLLAFALTGPFTPGTLEQIARDQVMPRLLRLPGVAGARLQGGAARGIIVRYDPAELRALAIPPQRLVEALAGARRLQPIGQITSGGQAIPLSVRDLPASTEALRTLPVDVRTGVSFPLGTLASVRTAEESDGRFLRVDGVPAVVMDVLRDPSASASQTAIRVRRVLADLGPSLSEGVTLRVLRDDSTELRQESVLLMRSALLALLLSLFMLWLVWRSSTAVAAMGACMLVVIAGTVLTLYLARVPVHRLTLAALSLSGSLLLLRGLMLVAPPDGRNRGLRISGSGAASLTAATMVPLLYLPAEARALFAPFAVTMLIVMGWSLLVTEAVIPAVTQRWPVERVTRRSPSRRARRLSSGMIRWRVVLVLLLGAGTLVVYGAWARSVEQPAGNARDDASKRSNRLTVQISFPRGTDPELLDRLTHEYEAMVVGHPAVSSVVAGSRTPTSARLVVRLHAGSERALEAQALQSRLVAHTEQGDGVTVQVMAEGEALSTGRSGASGTRYRLRVKGYEYAALARVADDLASRLAGEARVRDLRITSTSWAEGEPSRGLVLVPERQTMGRLGMSMVEVAQQVTRELRGGSGAQYVTVGGMERSVAVKGLGAEQRTVHGLASTWWTRRGGSAVRVADVMALREEQTLAAVVRDGQQYVRYLSYELRGAPHVTERIHRAFLAAIALPPGYHVEDVSQGDLEPAADDGSGFLFVGLLALGLTLVTTVGASDRLWCAAPQAFLLLLVPAGARVAFAVADVTWVPDAWVGIAYAMSLVAPQLLSALPLARGRPLKGVSAMVRRLKQLMACVPGFARGTAVVLAPPIALLLVVPTASLIGRIALATVGGVLAAMIGGTCLLPTLVMRRVR